MKNLLEIIYERRTMSKYSYILDTMQISSLKIKLHKLIPLDDFNVTLRRILYLADTYPTKLDLFYKWFMGHATVEDIPRLLYGKDELIFEYIECFMKLQEVINIGDEFNWYVITYGGFLPKSKDKELNVILGNIQILCDCSVDIENNKDVIHSFLYLIPSECYNEATILFDSMKNVNLLERIDLKNILYYVIKSLPKDNLTEELVISNVRNMIIKFNGFINSDKTFDYDNFTYETFNNYKHYI